jgi:hypothetical protein
MRFISPSMLLLALIALVLPWVDVRCESMSLVTQTGIQAVMGEASISKDLKDLQKMGDKGQGGDQEVKPFGDKGESAVLVIVWATLAAAGVLLGLVLGLSRGRAFLLGACAVGGVACLLVQAYVVKFPIEEATRKDMGKNQAKKPNPGLPGANLPEPKFSVELKAGFWLALGATLASLGGVIAECAVGSPSPRRRRDEVEEEYT